MPVSINAPNTLPQSGFISFPSGKLTVDPAGKGGLYVDMAYSKWLPVPRNSVSPDGKRYAYPSQTADNKVWLHVITVAGGADHVYRLPDELYSGIGGIDVFDYAADGVYMGLLSEGGILGLWVLDLVTGNTHKVGNLPGIGAIGGGAAWLGSLNKGDSHPLSFPPGWPANQIERVDLSNGSRQTWYYKPGSLVGVIGFDGKHPIVNVFIDRDHVSVLLLLDANHQEQIATGSANAWMGYLDSYGGGIITDSHGTWFGASELGLYLYVPGIGVKRVSDQRWLRPANGCF
jgi:hypothetical protein